MQGYLGKISSAIDNILKVPACKDLRSQSALASGSLMPFDMKKYSKAIGDKENYQCLGVSFWVSEAWSPVPEMPLDISRVNE